MKNQKPIHIKHPGALHKFLGVPKTEKLSTHQLMMAKGSPSKKVRAMANFALNAKGFHH